MRKLSLLLFLGISMQWAYTSNAQNKKIIPVRISCFTNNIDIPWKGKIKMFLVPLHPGLQVGTEFIWKTRPKHQLLQTAELSMYVIPELHYGLCLSSDFVFRYNNRNGLFWEGMAGLGYLHTFNYGPIYKLDSQGEYQKKTDWGRAHIAPEIALGGGYNFKMKEDNILALFIKYQFQIEYPFTIKGNIPLLPHTCIFVGVKFNLINH